MPLVNHALHPMGKSHRRLRLFGVFRRCQRDQGHCSYVILQVVFSHVCSPITSVMCAALFFALPSARNRELREITISTAGTSQAGRSASASAFVHSLNILVKYVRLYGFEHKRTETQFETAWNELQSALPKVGDQGF